jgi:hypothetical protein
MQSDTGAAFSGLPVFVLDSHYFIGKVAFSQVKVETVHRHQLRKEDVFSLLYRVVLLAWA